MYLLCVQKAGTVSECKVQLIRPSETTRFKWVDLGVKNALHVGCDRKSFKRHQNHSGKITKTILGEQPSIAKGHSQQHKLPGDTMYISLALSLDKRSLHVLCVCLCVCACKVGCHSSCPLGGMCSVRQ